MLQLSKGNYAKEGTKVFWREPYTPRFPEKQGILLQRLDTDLSLYLNL